MDRWLSARIDPRKEAIAVALLGWACFLAIPLGLQGIGLSWDALNHHIYLGWVADKPRFDRDFLAASYQSLQYPYPYWPVYKMAIGGASGTVAGAVLASLYALVIPALWQIGRACTPGETRFDAAIRASGVALACTSGLLLSLFDATSNDILASVPLVWAVALSLPAPQPTVRRIAIAGLLGGLAVACKLSNGPLVALLPVLWAWPAAPWKRRAMRVVAGGTLAVAGFLLAYGPWGWQLWSHFGNPIYPFADAWFVPLRSLLGWRP